MTSRKTASLPLDTLNITSGMDARLSGITAQRRPAYVNDSFRYVTKGADSEQPVGALSYQ